MHICTRNKMSNHVHHSRSRQLGRLDERRYIKFASDIPRIPMRFYLSPVRYLDGKSRKKGKRGEKIDQLQPLLFRERTFPPTCDVTDAESLFAVNEYSSQQVIH